MNIRICGIPTDRIALMSQAPGACFFRAWGDRVTIRLAALLLFAWLFSTHAPVGFAAEPLRPNSAATTSATRLADEPTTAAKKEPVAVRVAGREIDLWSYERGLEQYLKEVNAPATDTAAQRAFRDRLIDRLLVEAHAAETGLDQDRELQRRLAEARRRIIFDFVIDRVVLSDIKITTQSVKAHYDSHPLEFTEPETIQVRHIVTRTSESTEQARLRILAGEDFAAVAAEVSIHASKAQGGLLPAFTHGAYQPEFEAVAFALEVGELSGVVKTDLGYHVIEKTAEKPARLRPLSEVDQEIRRMLYERERTRRISEFVARLRKEAGIESKESQPEP